MRALAAIGLLFAGCFSPSFDNLRCDPEGDCPDGYTCVAGHCEMGGGSPDAAPGPHVVSTTPSPDSTDAEPSVAITATFSTAMDPSTITDTTFVVTVGGDPVSGTVSYDAPSQTATFTPSASLVLLTAYDAVITAGAMDTEGTALGAPHDWSFTVRDGAWAGEELLETEDTGQATGPKIGIDDAGNVIVVWQQQHGGSTFDIMANRYEPGTGWGTATFVEDDPGTAVSPSLAVHGDGTAIAVWGQNDGTVYNVYASRYVPGTGWGTPVPIDNLSNSAASAFAQVEMDAAGNAFAAWVQSDGTRANVWVNHYTVGTGWGFAEMIDTDNTASAERARLGVGPAGHAVVAWKQSDNLWANRYDPTSGEWGTDEEIDTGIGMNFAEQPSVAVDADGNATVVWSRFGTPSYSSSRRRSTPGGVWDAIEPLGDAASPSVAHDVVVDGDGIVTAFFGQFESGVGYNGMAVRYVPGTGWGTPEPIEAFDTGSSYAVVGAIDAGGNVIAAWQQQLGSGFDVWINRYRVGVGFGTPVLVEADENGSTRDIGVAMAPNGAAAVTYYLFTTPPDDYDVWANVFR